VALVDQLIKEGWLKTPRIIEAFSNIKREDFLPEDTKNLAELNTALPIGNGQTNSQPLTVAFMLEQLRPEAGNKILDIGSGSGWTSALLAYIVSKEELKSKIPPTGDLPKGDKNSPYGGSPEGRQKSKSEGKVIAIEIVPKLKEFGEKNTARYNFIKKGIAQFICADASRGYEKEAPFDRILASASAEKFPEEWKKQLKVGGRIVAPVKSSIWVLEKISEDEFAETEFPGFVFVPLIKK
jgi:protein-L-isoaspartate(D-aspartate) O-methyltransferase